MSGSRRKLLETEFNDILTPPIDNAVNKKSTGRNQTTLSVSSDSNALGIKSCRTPSPKFGRQFLEVRLKKRVLQDVFQYDLVLPPGRRRCLPAHHPFLQQIIVLANGGKNMLNFFPLSANVEYILHMTSWSLWTTVIPDKSCKSFSFKIVYTLFL